MSNSSRAISLVVAALLSGCASPPGQPKALDALYRSFESDRVARYSNPNSAVIAQARNSARARNDLMNDLILLIDHNYSRIEQGLYCRKAWADFGGSLVATGLSTAGTLAGGESVKTTLAALVTALESTKLAVNRDILQSQSMIVIIATMRKMRAEKLLEIRAAQKLPIGAYPLSLALDDLMDYYNAGTFIGALQGLTEDASAAKKAIDLKLKQDKAGASAIPPKLAPAHPDGVVPTASNASQPPTPPPGTVPEKTQPAHPEGVVETVR